MGNSTDRLLVTGLLAGAVHVGIIFGVRVPLPDPPKLDRTLDIELIEAPKADKPTQVDYRAQADSSGKAARPAKPKPVPPKPKPVAAPPQPKPQTLASSKPLTQPRSMVRLPAKQMEAPHLDRELLARQIAELVPTQTASFSPSARVVPIQQINAHKHIAAAYERAWQEKVERVGNLNYPEEARRQRLSGAVLASVWVSKDGQVKKIQIHRSSGQPVLDEAVQRIVRLAAPFAPFPLELANQADAIVITRTWKFYDEASLAMDH
ncbi:energy transducer TonB [Methylothermus subterraneus]